MAGLFEGLGIGPENQSQALGLALLNAAGGISSANGKGAGFLGSVVQGLPGFGQGLMAYPQMQQQQQLRQLQALKVASDIQKAQTQARQMQAWQKMFGTPGINPNAPSPGQPSPGPQMTMGNAPGQTPPMVPTPQAPNTSPITSIPPNMLPFIAAMGPEKGSAFMAQFLGRKVDPKDRYMNVPGVGLVDLSGGKPSLAMPAADDEQLVEIYDPNSPTGTRMVPRSQASGQPGKPGSGFKIVSDGKGGFTVEQGRLGNGRALSTPTANKIDEKLINSTELLSRLTDVSSQFKPEYLQLGTRLNMAGLSLKDFAGIDMDAASKKELANYSAFRRASINNINRILNELSGAAVSPSEAERLKSAYPNAGIGVFDGDGPTQFKTKLEAATKETRNAILRYNYAKANGMNPLKTGVELQDVPALVEKRGAALEKEVRAAMPNATPEAIKLETRARLAREFGMQ